MSGEMRAYVPGIQHSATRFGHVAEDVQQVFDTLQSALDGEGQAWGDDESGQSFAQEYVPNSQKTLEALGKTVEALHGIKDSLNETAADIESTDGDIGQGMHAIGNRM